MAFDPVDNGSFVNDPSADTARQAFEKLNNYLGAINTAMKFSGPNVGFGTASPSTNLHLRGASNPTLRFQENGVAGYFDIFNANDRSSFIRHVNSGPAEIMIEPEAIDGASSAFVNLLVSTSTTGAGGFRVYETGSSSIAHELRSDGSDSYLNADGGNLGIGTASPTSGVDIQNGALTVQSHIQESEPATIADDATHSFDQIGPVSAGSTATALVTVLTSSTDQTCAVFIADGNSTQALYAGSSVSLGDATNPDVDGDINIWVDAGDHISIRNRIGAPVDFVVKIERGA